MVDKLMKAGFIVLSVAVAYVIFLKVELIRMGGPVMIPIILVSILAFSIIYTKLRQFFKNDIDAETVMNSVFESMERQRIKEAIDLCDQINAPLTRILKAAIMKYDRPKDDIKEAIENAFLYEIPVLEKNIYILATVIQVAPILGLLGILTGMMNIFSAVGIKGVALSAVSLADIIPGIWTALVCSVSGFVVAISVLIAHNYFQSRVKSFIDESERVLSEFVAFLIDRRLSS